MSVKLLRKKEIYLSLNVLLFVLFCFPSLSLANDSSPQNRPKIGLVLSGGGALGFAHVGVLKILREENVPVDIVTGTSMGAIVGAAYSSGRTIEEMEEVLTETDWDHLFSESEPRSSLPYRLKPGTDREIVGKAKIGFKDGELALPGGFIQGQNVLPLLQRLYDGVPNPVNLDDLTIPFRGISADIENGDVVVFNSGHLPSIVRASMSVPGVFSPIEVQGRFLVDGGIVNNLPVDIAQQLGADKLIVVDLTVPMKKKDELGSPLSITGQMVSLLLAQNSAIQRGNMKSNDLLIDVDLTGYTAGDFAEGAKIMDIGEEVASNFRKELQKLSISDQEYAAYEKMRTTPLMPDTSIDFIKVENTSFVSDSKIKELLDVQPGDKLDRAYLEKQVRSLYEYGYFSEVTYEIVEENGATGVLVKADDKPWLDNYARVGAAFSDDFDGDSNYRIALSYRQSAITLDRSYWETDLEIGRSPRLETELYLPLSESSAYFVAPKFTIGRSNLLARDSGDIIAEYHRLTGTGAIRLGRALGRNGEISIKGLRGFGDLEKEIGDPTLPEFSYDIGEASANVVYDSLDQVDFPTEGMLLTVSHRSSLDEMGASDSFDDITGRFSLPYTFGRNTLLFSGDFGVTYNNRPVERSFTLGGFLDLSGYEQNALIASDFGIGRVVGYRRFSEAGSPLLGLEFFLGGSVEVATLQSDLESVEDNSMIVAGSVFLGVDTPLLPAYLGVGLNDEDDVSIYFALGRIANNIRE